ncbi:MAG: hypothetical protein OXT65_04845 [Alphaproteobacteria bacterium]|nr:hypothetical protein [Alphaproteobacteria bacterium]
MFKKKKKTHPFDANLSSLLDSVENLQQINDVAERYEALQQQIEAVDQAVREVQNLKGYISDGTRDGLALGSFLGGAFGGMGLITVGTAAALPALTIVGPIIIMAGMANFIGDDFATDYICDKIESRRHVAKNRGMLNMLKALQGHLSEMKDTLVNERIDDLVKSKHADRLLSANPELAPAFAKALLDQRAKDEKARAYGMVVKTVKLPKPRPQ